MFFVNTVVICIRYRATMPLSSAWFQRTLILVIRDPVFIGILFPDRRRCARRGQPDTRTKTKHLVVKGAGVGGIVETGQPTAEITIQHDLTQFEAGLCVNTETECFIL